MRPTDVHLTFLSRTLHTLFQDTHCDLEPTRLGSVLFVLPHLSLEMFSIAPQTDMDLAFIMPSHSPLVVSHRIGSAVEKEWRGRRVAINAKKVSCTLLLLWHQDCNCWIMISPLALLSLPVGEEFKKNKQTEQKHWQRKSCMVPWAATCKPGCPVTYCLTGYFRMPLLSILPPSFWRCEGWGLLLPKSPRKVLRPCFLPWGDLPATLYSETRKTNASWRHVCSRVPCTIS